MSQPHQILAGSQTIVVIDWPSPEVPAALAAAGLTVIVKGGPGPADYTAWEYTGGEITRRPLGGPPGHADLVYVHRPLAELAAVIALARSLGAAAVWRQSGRNRAGERDPAGCWLPPGESEAGRALAAAAGLGYVDDLCITDVARSFGNSG